MKSFTSPTSWMAVTSALALIGATYLAPKHQPATLRPFTMEGSAARPLPANSVPARLWQDPLEAGWKRIPSASSEVKTNKLLWKQWIDAKDSLADHKADYYLPIILSGNPYPESRERRLRNRFALQEAMEAMGYRPLNYETLNYIPVPLAMETTDDKIEPKDEKLGAIVKHEEKDFSPSPFTFKYQFVPVTYELFESSEKMPAPGKKTVIVFWIDEQIISTGKTPNYKNIETLANHIGLENKQGDVLNLSGSNKLLKLLKSGNKKDPLPTNTKVYFTLSSAPKMQLIDALAPDEIDPEISKQIFRTTPSDNYVLSAIVDELQRRIPKFGEKEEEKDKVWLLSEQDTFYSQVMEDEFIGIAQARKLNVDVKSIRFLKGIDGNQPDDPATVKPESGKSLDSLAGLIQRIEQSGPAEQRLFDRRQIDYLQRLAEKLWEEERDKPPSERVKAIGILGGDVYDKILALELFRQRFPATNYFTTDLDAAYLYGPAAKTTRNLIIASAFGLSPESTKCTGDDTSTVVFRDSYQTALYHSVKNVVEPCKALKELTVKLYEVERSSFHKFEPDDPESKRDLWYYPDNLAEEPITSTRDPKKGVNTGPSGEGVPVSERPFSILSYGPLWLLVLVAVAAILNLALVTTGFRKALRWFPEKADLPSPLFNHALVKKLFSDDRSFFTWALILLAGILLAVVLLFLPEWVINDLMKDLEPMHWREGISAWPSVLLRLAIFGSGIVMLVSSLVKGENARDKLKVTLGSRDAVGKHPDVKVSYRGGKPFSGTLFHDLRQIFFLTMILMTALMITFFVSAKHSDGFFTPGRGGWIFLCHEISLALSLSMLLLLVWWAAFRHYRCRTLLSTLHAELKQERRPSDSGSASPGEHGASLSSREVAALEGYAGISSVTLLPPFALMVLLLVSRHTMFDGWNIPLILIVFLSFMLFILLVSAFQLSTAARRLKVDEINYHKMAAEPDKKKKKAGKMATLWQSASGPFGNYQQQPISQALIFSVAGFGISFIEPLFRFFGM